MRTTIALVGPIASGKGHISELLKSRGFAHFTYGDEVRKEISLRGLPLERRVYQDVSDILRIEQGTPILAQRIASEIQRERQQGRANKAIIDGLRHPDEVEWLKTHFNTKVLGVTAPPELRFQRLLDRARPSDPGTREGFDVVEQRDRGVGQPDFGNHVDASLRLADIVIENTETPDILEGKLNLALVSLGIEGYPDFPEGNCPNPMFRR
jgi:dephospho-CoA kinase